MRRNTDANQRFYRNFLNTRFPKLNAFDKLFEKSKQEINDSLKIKLYQKMDSLIIADAPVVPLYYDQVIRLVNLKIQNLGNNSMNLLNLKTVTKQH
jgi:peptide/nickel transport system substrate-binding protein